MTDADNNDTNPLPEQREVEVEVVEGEGDPLSRARTALNIACQNIVALNDKNARLTEALHKALALQDALLTELSIFQRKAQVPPSVTLMAAKHNFDVAMKALLGG